jgi:hypothetical protein
LTTQKREEQEKRREEEKSMLSETLKGGGRLHSPQGSGRPPGAANRPLLDRRVDEKSREHKGRGQLADKSKKILQYTFLHDSVLWYTILHFTALHYFGN